MGFAVKSLNRSRLRSITWMVSENDIIEVVSLQKRGSRLAPSFS